MNQKNIPIRIINNKSISPHHELAVKKCNSVYSYLGFGGLQICPFICKRPNDLAMRLRDGFSAWNCRLVRLHFDYNSSKAEVIRKCSVPWPCRIFRVNIFVNKKCNKTCLLEIHSDIYILKYV